MQKSSQKEKNKHWIDTQAKFTVIKAFNSGDHKYKKGEVLHQTNPHDMWWSGKKLLTGIYPAIRYGYIEPENKKAYVIYMRAHLFFLLKQFNIGSRTYRSTGSSDCYLGIGRKGGFVKKKSYIPQGDKRGEIITGWKLFKLIMFGHE